MASLLSKDPDASSPSSDYAETEDDRAMIRAILGGASAVREGGTDFLPQFTAEDAIEYGRRRDSTPWRPEFVDALRGITSKPFTKEVAIQGETSATIKTFCEDVDTMGNNLHVFAKRVFWSGVAFGLHGILVDYPTMRPGMTLADERQSGAKPYWVHVPADNLIALYAERVAGKTIVTHARIREFITERDGWGERTIERVRVFEPGRWELWERQDPLNTTANNELVQVGEGEMAIPQVPLALFYTGDRIGSMARPPLIDLAHMQIELYQALSRQEEVLTFSGFPMLCANGMNPPDPNDPGMPTLEVGPKRVLFAPPSNGPGPQPSWSFVQPNAGNITEIRAHVQSVIDDMRRLGLQPLTPRSGDVTATGSSIEAAKAHSAVEGWATALKDTLEQALVFTSQWLEEETTAEVFVHTDFGVDIDGGSDMDALLKARMAGEISQETYWDELLRRGKLGPQFDPDEEKNRLEQEGSIEDEAMAEAEAALERQSALAEAA